MNQSITGCAAATLLVLGTAAVAQTATTPPPQPATLFTNVRVFNGKGSGLSPGLTCAVERRDLTVGDRPTRQLSLQPVVIGAVVEETKRLKPSV